ncbi:hypothetical protein, partial [Nocardioides sp.]|uniref:hypothetical protein n=1 Tax=Nocardioides sp. TaxID=35761 RepID=UPI00286D72CE
VRTAAVERVLRTRADVTDEALQAAYGLIRTTASDAGWIDVAEREVPRYEGKMKPPLARGSSRRSLT